jgi:hypothetical protein
MEENAMACCQHQKASSHATAREAEKAPTLHGPGGNPMEMMQKMMAQMSQGAGPPPMMQMCMSMCSEMLNAIRQTSAMANYATPELRHAFGAWLNGTEAKAQLTIADGAKDAAALAAEVEIDETSARYVVGRLAADGKVTLTAQARCKGGVS